MDISSTSAVILSSRVSTQYKAMMKYLDKYFDLSAQSQQKQKTLCKSKSFSSSQKCQKWQEKCRNSAHRNKTEDDIPDVIDEDRCTSLTPSSLPFIGQYESCTLEGREKLGKFTVSTVFYLNDVYDVHTVNTTVDVNYLDRDLTRHYNTVTQLESLQYNTVQQQEVLQQQSKGWQSWFKTWSKRK